MSGESWARRARPWVERTARVGFAAKSLVYFVVAGLSARAALGVEDAVGPLDAIAEISRTFVGRVLLVAAIPGFAAYCLWRISQALFAEQGRSLVQLVNRTGMAVTGLVYGVLCYVVTREVLGLDERTFAPARGLFDAAVGTTWGRVGFGVVGLVLVGVGVVQFGVAYTARFKETLRLDHFRTLRRRALIGLGRLAFTAWGVVFVLMGWGALNAAWSEPSPQAQSIGDTLREVERSRYEPWPLGLLAAGLGSFALYAAFEARLRKIEAA